MVLLLAGHPGPGERGSQVVVVATQPLHPNGLLGAPNPDPRLLRKREKAFGVATPKDAGLFPSLEPLRGVLPDRLEQPVAHLPRLLLGDDERRVDQAADELDRALVIAAKQTVAATARA